MRLKPLWGLVTADGSGYLSISDLPWNAGLGIPE